MQHFLVFPSYLKHDFMWKSPRRHLLSCQSQVSIRGRVFNQLSNGLTPLFLFSLAFGFIVPIICSFDFSVLYSLDSLFIGFMY